MHADLQVEGEEHKGQENAMIVAASQNTRLLKVSTLTSILDISSCYSSTVTIISLLVGVYAYLYSSTAYVSTVVSYHVVIVEA